MAERWSVLFIVLILVWRAWGQDMLDFLVFGDWGGIPFYPYHTTIEASVAAQMSAYAQKHNVQFVLALGDNFYTEGVKNVHDPRFQETFESVYNGSYLGMPWYVVAGNHDHNGNVSAQIEYTRYSKRWMFPNYYYSLEFTLPSSGTTLQIVMIDTVVLCGNSDKDWLGLQPQGPEDEGFAEEQWAWINQQLSSSSADYLVAAGHYPVYSIAEHGPTTQLVERLMPMLHKARANAYFCGHDHNIQHLEYTDYEHTVEYFVSGAGNTIDPSIEHLKSVPPNSLRYHWADITAEGAFAHVTVTPQNMTFTFVEANGDIMYKKVMMPRK